MDYIGETIREIRNMKPRKVDKILSIVLASIDIIGDDSGFSVVHMEDLDDCDYEWESSRGGAEW